MTRNLCYVNFKMNVPVSQKNLLLMVARVDIYLCSKLLHQFFGHKLVSHLK